jgi:hypothetical protein
VRALSIAIVAALLALTPASARAFCRTTTSGTQPDPSICPVGGVPIAWTGGCASISINPLDVPSDITLDQFRTEVSNAANRWSSADCGGGATPSFHFVAFPDCPHGAEWNPSGRNANTVSFRTTWGQDPNHPVDAIAVTITTFGLNDGSIRDADTELNLRSSTNADGFSFTVGAPTGAEVDLPTVLTHELGHAQGLAHSPDHLSVMYFSAGLGQQTRMLFPDDVAGICTIYPPGRMAACDPEPHGGFECGSNCGCSTPGRGASVPWRAALVVVAIIAVNATRSARSRPRP